MSDMLIVKTGSTFPATRRRFGDYDRWFLDALQDAPGRYRVHDITVAPPPSLERYRGVIVTGSPAAVYERPPWLEDLRRMLRRIAERQRPAALCVCFGAQALAEALGGNVIKSPSGWEIGSIRVRLTEDGRNDPLLSAGAEEELAFQATHQDRVESLPEGATLLASNDLSPVQAFRVGEQVWATQFHPEASSAILEDLIRARRPLLEAGAGGPEGYRTVLRGLAPTAAGTTLLARFVRLAELPGAAPAHTRTGSRSG